MAWLTAVVGRQVLPRASSYHSVLGEVQRTIKLHVNSLVKLVHLDLLIENTGAANQCD